MFTDCDGCPWGPALSAKRWLLKTITLAAQQEPRFPPEMVPVPVFLLPSSKIVSLFAHPSCPCTPAFKTCMFGVLFRPFPLTSLLFFLSCFLEPWWHRSGETEAQLGLHRRGEADTNFEGRERKEKMLVKLSHISQLQHPLRYYLFYFFSFCLHGCHGLTDLCPRHYLNWIWFLETHQSPQSVGQLRQIIDKKKTKKNTPKCLTEGSTTQMVRNST